MELRAPGDRDVTIGAVVPNVQTEKLYRQLLEREVAAMVSSYEHWIAQAYKRVLSAAQRDGRVIDPELALDARSGPKDTNAALFVELKRLDGYWTARVKRFAEKTAKRIATDWLRENTTSWQTKLKRKGFTVKLQVSAKQRTFLQVKIAENVSLIRSIQQQYHKNVEGIVSRGFLAGRDLFAVAETIRKQHGVTVRRAALIARDQSNKATAQLNSMRQSELGITRATWIHSSAGKEPRHDHMRAGREGWEFDPTVGIDFADGSGFVLPGEAINCFPGDSKLVIAQGCKRLWRRRIRIELTEFVTEAGETIRATPNHPILTARGWVAAKSLNLGDHVVRVPDKLRDRVEVDVEDGVPSLSEFFATAAAYITPVSRAGATFQFHGDVADSDVDVVDIDRFLPLGMDAARCQQLAEFLFSDTDAAVYTATLCADRAIAQCVRRISLAPEFVISGAGALLPLFKGMRGGRDDIGLRLRAWFDTLFEQASANGGPRDFVPFADFQLADACEVVTDDIRVGRLLCMLARAASRWQCDTPHANVLGDYSGADTDDTCRLRESGTSYNQLDRIVELRLVDFTGHVYNLETTPNWYGVGAYIVHNCRCTCRSHIPALKRGGHATYQLKDLGKFKGVLEPLPKTGE